MEVFVLPRLHARPGQREAVRAAMFEVHGPTRQEPGCLPYGAFHSVRDPDEFYIHSRWQDRAAFELHAEQPHTVRIVATAQPLLDHPFTASLVAPLSAGPGDRRLTAPACRTSSPSPRTDPPRRWPRRPSG